MSETLAAGREPDAVPVGGRRRMNEIVGQVLADHIRSGALPEGFVIREKAVTNLFGIGRMPAVSAMMRLEAEGLVHRRPSRRGVIVGPHPTDISILGELATHVVLPPDVVAELRVRNWRALIYASVEKEVASCLLFGRFQIRSQILAEHFGVSRTIAHELLLRLERVGLVRQESNARWYAGPLTPGRIKELYEMRILLEPPALRQAAPRLDPRMICERLTRVCDAETPQARADPSLLHRLEVDLHHDIVLKCSNDELRETLYRCQLPLITAHLSFGSYREQPDIPRMIVMHKAILSDLAEGRVDDAACVLESHLRESSDNNPRRLAGLPPLDRIRLSPYLDPA
ncbi:GntR family transcriptional regulator [Labrys okinawensis]|uniref:GntR family transcriptional regulator n=1 Tax=Labrys okinawensis TaxID=346911 RepID=UPI0039BC57BC